jgi:hypothetical protein
MDRTTMLSLARIALGAAAWAAPERGLRAVGLDASAAQSPYLVRLFGGRDIAFGALTLLAEPHARPGLLRLGIAIDATDAAAGLQLARRQGVGTPTAALLTGGALGAVLGGLLALRQQPRR